MILKKRINKKNSKENAEWQYQNKFLICLKKMVLHKKKCGTIV